MSESNIYLIVGAIYVLVLANDIFKLFKLIKRPDSVLIREKYFQRINYVVLLFGFVLSLVLIAFEVNFFKYSSPVYHSDYETITLKDFNGFKMPNQRLQGSEKFAFIVTDITYDITGKNVDCYSRFHPSRSYVYIDDLESPDLLRHEIYHFHITEIHARKLRRLISEKEDLPSRSTIKKLYEKVKREESITQSQYDYDTDHGFLLGKQVEWQLKIDSLLLNLEKFKNPRIQF